MKMRDPYLGAFFPRTCEGAVLLKAAGLRAVVDELEDIHRLRCRRLRAR